MPDDLWTLGIAETARAYETRRATPLDMLASVVERLNGIEKVINAFAFLDLEGAARRARESQARWRAGTALGPLDGAIITIKDNITVLGMPCVWGSLLFKDFVPQTEEPAVTHLRQAGAILLGKTNVSEFTVGRGNVSTALFGTTRNPWKPALSTGASSGGAAAALAGGLCAGALGTDGGGSIRRPASHCGVLGLKPTRGRVARWGGLPAILGDCEVIGPMARTAADLAILFQAIDKPDRRDVASFLPRGRLAGVDRPLRIRFVSHLGNHELDPAVLAATELMAERLEALGHRVEPGPVPYDVALHEEHWPVIAQAGLARLVRDRDWKGRVAPHIEAMIEAGSRLAATQYVDALAAFTTIQIQLQDFFRDCDLLMTPAVGAFNWSAETTGPAHERVFTRFVNAAGLPAITVPVAGQPLPIGTQFVSAFGQDEVLLALASLIERHHPWVKLARFP